MDFYQTFFPNLGHLKRYIPLNGMFLEFSVEKKTFHLSKRALRAGTARNKWLKEALAVYFEYTQNRYTAVRIGTKNTPC